MTLQKIFRKRLLVGALVVMLVVAASGYGQASCTFQMDEIPEPRRTELSKLINSVVTMQKKGNWADIFLVLPVEYLQGETLAEFLARHKAYRSDAIENNFLDFKPNKIKIVYKTDDSERWMIEGCGRWKFESKDLEQYAYISAFWRADKWLVTPVLFDLPLHSGFIPCKK